MSFKPLPPRDHACHYLPGLEARTAHFLLRGEGDEVLERLLASGYRHFGVYFFRPECPDCVRCIPIRVPVPRYHFTRSNRRVLRKHTDLSTVFETAGPQPESFDLFLEHKKRFGTESIDEETYESYSNSFYAEDAHRRTLSVYEADRLVARMHLDWTERVASAVYCYYDDTLPGRSLGTYSILKSIEAAMEAGKEYFYLGYYIGGNRSMRYKLRYYPNQIYDGRRWIDARDEAGVIVAPNQLARTRRPLRLGT